MRNKISIGKEKRPSLHGMPSFSQVVGWLCVAATLMACEYNDTEPPQLRDWAVNNRTNNVGLRLSDTLIVTGIYTDDASLGGINIQLEPLAEPPEGRWLPPFRSLDTLFNIGGISVVAASRLPLSANRYAKGSYRLTSTFFDAAGNQGLEENSIEVALINPRPHIHLTSYLSDTVRQSISVPIRMEGEAIDYEGTLRSLRLLIRRLEVNPANNSFVPQDPPAFDTTFVLRGMSHIDFSESFLADSIGFFRFSALATDNDGQQTNMVTFLELLN